MDVMDATTCLQQLADELTGRGWKAKMRGADGLFVANPGAGRLSDTIRCDGTSLLWNWGQPIGPADEVAAVADRIQYVLREVGS